MRMAKGALCAAALLATGAASAATTVTVANIRGTWSGAVFSGSAGSIDYAGNGTSSATARWGTPTGTERSGFDFDALSPSPVAVAVPGASSTFGVADFAHVNFTTAIGTDITSLLLNVVADISVDGTPIGPRSFAYRFLVDQTPNGLNPCPFGGANGSGVNINGCADRVQVQFLSTSSSFAISGVDYTLDLVGFRQGGSFVTSFLTSEEAVNRAQLVGRITTFQSAIPEPGTWAMMILGFGAVGTAMRRRRGARPVVC